MASTIEWRRWLTFICDVSSIQIQHNLEVFGKYNLLNLDSESSSDARFKHILSIKEQSKSDFKKGTSMIEESEHGDFWVRWTNDYLKAFPNDWFSWNASHFGVSVCGTAIYTEHTFRWNEMHHENNAVRAPDGLISGLTHKIWAHKRCGEMAFHPLVVIFVRFLCARLLYTTTHTQSSNIIVSFQAEVFKLTQWKLTIHKKNRATTIQTTRLFCTIFPLNFWFNSCEFLNSITWYVYTVF